MSSESADCRATGALVAELALGISAGEERARALEHAARCPSCRAELTQMSTLADELLLLAPADEPPVGFESSVTERIESSRRRAPRRRWAAAAAAAAVGVAAAAGVLEATQDERELGERYQRTLQIANGSYFSAARLRTPSGTSAGHVFGYQGSPSWMFVVVSAAGRSGRFGVTARTTDGRRLVLGSMTVKKGSGSWGVTLPVALHDLTSVDLEGSAGRLVAWL
jgi:hypothetical protein